MSAITFLSDFGADSHYMASFRGGLIKQGVSLPFIEISSAIEPFDIIEAAYIISMVYSDFPQRSIHILATNVVATSFDGHLAAVYDNHLFLAPDNGILPLVFGPEFNDYRLIETQQFEQNISNVYVPFIKRLLKADGNLDQITSKIDQINTKSALIPVRDERELRGTVLYVDHFGNAYTNISKSVFSTFVQDQQYRINLSKNEWLERVSENFADVRDGDALSFFSDHGFLVVAIKKGNACQLLNLRKYKPLIIELK